MGDKNRWIKRGKKVLSPKEIAEKREKDAKWKIEKRAQEKNMNYNEASESFMQIEEDIAEDNANEDIIVDDACMEKENAPLNEASNSITMETNACMYLNLYIQVYNFRFFLTNSVKI